MFVEYDFIDGDELEKLLPKLNKYDDELPFVLFDYIDKFNYFARVSDEVKSAFFIRKDYVMAVDNILNYLEYDFRDWIKNNPKFKTLLKELD